jgi:hypothetical protein
VHIWVSVIVLRSIQPHILVLQHQIDTVWFSFLSVFYRSTFLSDFVYFVLHLLSFCFSVSNWSTFRSIFASLSLCHGVFLSSLSVSDRFWFFFVSNRFWLFVSDLFSHLFSIYGCICIGIFILGFTILIIFSQYVLC